MFVQFYWIAASGESELTLTDFRLLALEQTRVSRGRNVPTKLTRHLWSFRGIAAANHKRPGQTAIRSVGRCRLARRGIPMSACLARSLVIHDSDLAVREDGVDLSLL